jgi:integrase
MHLRGLYRQPHSGIYYYQPPQVGGVRPKPINLRTKDENEAVEAYYQAKHLASEAFRRGTLQMEGARFVKDCRDSKAQRPASADQTARVIRFAVDAMGNREVSSYTQEDVKKLHRQWLAADLSAATISTYLARLSSFFAWAIGERLTKVNPVQGIAMPRDLPTRSERYCTKAERDLLISTVPEGRPDLALVLWLGFFTGLRRSEIDAARRGWVDLEAGVIRVRIEVAYAPKSARGVRVIRLSPRLHAFLTDYLALPDVQPARADKVGDGAKPRKTPALYQVDDFLLRPDKLPGRKQRGRGKKANRYRYDARSPFDRHCAEQGLDWVGFHTMRHTFGTLHALAGTPLSVIAGELGDRLSTVERHYIGYQRGGSHSAAVD